MTEPRDRRAKLLDPAQTVLNGIDFVEIVNTEQTRLRIHFLVPVMGAIGPAVVDTIAKATITGGDTIPSVDVHPITTADWSYDSNHRPMLDLSVDAPGDFSQYQLALVPVDPSHAVLDRYFDHVGFTFKAGCPSTLDCEPPPHECPPCDSNAPPIDYLAKDFDSFKRALLEFSALRYPSWQERSEADFGVMFAEALSSVADDLSYFQDRIAAEGWIETATERRSLVRLARLVDYEPRVATAATTLLRFEMQITGSITPGTVVSALASDGSSIDFETGEGLADKLPRDVDPAWNTIQPWYFDDADRCLPRGATAMWIVRPSRTLSKGQLLLIETARASSADPPIRQLVRLTEPPADETDTLLGQQLSRITWGAGNALRVEHDLTLTVLAANLVPCTQGRRHIERFVVDPVADAPLGPTPAMIRTGANGSDLVLYPLRAAPLAWLAQSDPDEAPRPELRLVELSTLPRTWTWRRSLLATTPFDTLFTIDPMQFRALDPRGSYLDYDGDAGATIRFGDGAQSAIPETGMTVEVTFRVGGGEQGNVAADAVTRIDASSAAVLGITSVSNPFPATGGRDAEPDAQVRELAPQKFRARPLRVVRTGDYEDAARTLGWVQQAGTRFRYTGSWLTAFTSVDPRGSETVGDDETLELTRLLDRRRLAGYESFVLQPRFVSLDLKIELCLRPAAFRSDVERAVASALDTRVHLDGTLGFFHPDRFSFGLPLERSVLEAALQEVHGVDGVIQVWYRRRGQSVRFAVMPDAVAVAIDEIVRVDNDLDHPERGSLLLQLTGGK